MERFFRHIPIVLVLFFASGIDMDAYSQQLTEINGNEFLVDEFALLEIQDGDINNYKIVSKYEDILLLNYGVTDEPVYFLVSFDNPFHLNENIVLEIKNPGFRTIELYQKDADQRFKRIGMKGIAVPHGEFSNSLNPSFRLNPDDRVDLILKIESKIPISFGAGISPINDFEYVSSIRMLFINIYIGIMLSLFLYNAMLYFSVKDKVYLIYCFYILFISLAQLSLSGYSYQYIFHFNYEWFEKSIIIFSCLSGIFAVLFIRNFLKTSILIPKLDKVLIFTGLLYGVTVYFGMMAYMEISYFLVDIAGLFVAVFFFTSAVVTWRMGYRPAKYFLGAWSFFLIGVVLFVLKNNGVQSFQTFSNFPMLIGTALEAILLSLALADRINILKKEKETEQREKVQALSENERLIKEQNVYLEKMVHSRTEELERTLKNLQATQTQLVNQEKMASLGQLTAGIAHEINNPINFVSSNISPLKRDISDIMEVIDLYRTKGELEFSADTKKELKNLEDEIELDYLIREVEQLLSGIEDGARRTVEIVRGLRLFSRVDEQDVKRVNIHDGLDSTLILLNNTMQGRIKITKEYGELPMVECLAGKLNQVFMNVINNAIHALMDTNHMIKNPEITIRTATQGECVRIEIQDNGPGMPDRVKEKIFEPFFTTKEVGRGTGLGLSIVYTVIENHNGRLEVNSKVNEGTVFVIILPIQQKSRNNEG